MATKYDRGRRAEWRLRDQLEAGGWTVIRAAGSKGPYDLVAFPRVNFNDDRVVAIQVKTTSSPVTARALLKAFQPQSEKAYVTQLWIWHARQWTMVRWDDEDQAKRTHTMWPVDKT